METDSNWANFLYNGKTNQIELLHFGAARVFGNDFGNDFDNDFDDDFDNDFDNDYVHVLLSSGEQGPPTKFTGFQ